MAKRKPVKKSTDKKVFKNTANKIKVMNLNNKPMRGGIRL